MNLKQWTATIKSERLQGRKEENVNPGRQNYYFFFLIWDLYLIWDHEFYLIVCLTHWHMQHETVVKRDNF